MMRKYLYFTVFASGMTTLALELSASRLLEPYFGTSNLVWASIIGLILIYLTLGYFLGGRWADRSPFPKTMYTILVWGAFTAGLMPLVARPVLRLASDAFDRLQVAALLGSFTATLILFIVPVTLLGMISPFAIRLAIDNPREAGALSGKIYAISTLGSFIGTFLPSLLMTPLIGTTDTFYTFGIFLCLVGLAGLWRIDRWRGVLPWAWMPLALLVLAVLPAGALKNTAGQIYETESAYNYIQVIEKDGYRLLRLNEGQGIHSQWHPTQLNYYGPWEQFLVGPFFNAPLDHQTPYGPERVQRMAIVGLAAGTIARQATAVFGPIPIDGFEIDPKIIEVGRKFFDMNMPNLNAIAQDGRWGLAHSARKYSLIGVDAYRPPYIPWHLTTREFFQIARDHLAEDGVLVINVGRSPTDRSLIDGLAGTIGAVFPSLFIADVPGSFNTVIFATVQPAQAMNLYLNFNMLKGRGDVHPLLIETMQTTIAMLQPVPQSTGVVFTDDWAPVEWMTNRMILRFMLFGDTEALQ